MSFVASQTLSQQKSRKLAVFFSPICVHLGGHGAAPRSAKPSEKVCPSLREAMYAQLRLFDACRFCPGHALKRTQGLQASAEGTTFLSLKTHAMVPPP